MLDKFRERKIYLTRETRLKLQSFGIGIEEELFYDDIELPEGLAIIKNLGKFVAVMFINKGIDEDNLDVIVALHPINGLGVCDSEMECKARLWIHLQKPVKKL
jgi:hypothetical protein